MYDHNLLILLVSNFYYLNIALNIFDNSYVYLFFISNYYIFDNFLLYTISFNLKLNNITLEKKGIEINENINKNNNINYAFRLKKISNSRL